MGTIVREWDNGFNQDGSRDSTKSLADRLHGFSFEVDLPMQRAVLICADGLDWFRRVDNSTRPLLGLGIGGVRNDSEWVRNFGTPGQQGSQFTRKQTQVTQSGGGESRIHTHTTQHVTKFTLQQYHSDHIVYTVDVQKMNGGDCCFIPYTGPNAYDAHFRFKYISDTKCEISIEMTTVTLDVLG